jgi:hypothetical protein
MMKKNASGGRNYLLTNVSASLLPKNISEFLQLNLHQHQENPFMEKLKSK